MNLLRLVAVALMVGLLTLHLTAQPAAGKKYALLVGVKKYQHKNLPDLRYSENDVVELAKILKSAGYEVALLCDSKGAKKADREPTAENIKSHLKTILERSKREDTVLIALAGHGMEFEKDEKDQVLKDAYFCPSDGRPFVDRRSTLISLKKVYDDLEQSFAGVKILLVDACRNDPKLGRGARTGIDGDNAPRPPRGVAAIFSCSAGELAYEHEKYQHGVFFHHVLEGLRGQAKNSQGKVTFASLADYASSGVSEDVPKLIGGGAKQSPNLKADLSGASPVLIAAPVDAAEGPSGKLFTSTIGMKLVRIEPGTFRMGSPAAELERQTNEEQHEVKITKPFYIGKYEVTQEEYEKIMDKNPSWFSKNGGGKERVGQDTKRLPVENVSWEDAKEFCRKLTKKERQEGKITGKMEYTLPTEAEWEYCCRAGTKTPFHFGETISTDQANYYGLAVYGNGKKGENRGKTTEVGNFAANAWDLHDMHGNVCEWCEDAYDKDFYTNGITKDPLCTNGQDRVLRGGSWNRSPQNCRSAFRFFNSPENRNGNNGFRVVLRLSPRTP